MKKRKRRGNCYVTCEALYHLLGGKAAGYVPHTVRHEGGTHWYLVHRTRRWYLGYLGMGGADVKEYDEVIIDPTFSQFKTPPHYSKGKGRGFLTKGPSKRARAMMEKMVWQ